MTRSAIGVKKIKSPLNLGSKGSDQLELSRLHRLRRILYASCLIIVAFNLRTVFSSTSALLPEIVSQYKLSPFGAGVLTSLPVVALGLFSTFAPLLARRIGPERTILAIVFVLALSLAFRGVGSISILFICTTLAGACIAIANVLLPSLVKERFPHRVALITGGYTMSLCVGAACAAGLTLPIKSKVEGSVGLALAAWALPAVLAFLCWLPLAILAGGRLTKPVERRPTLWRDPLAWQVTMFMGLQSALAYCVFGWLVPILRERDVEPSTAGHLVAICVVSQGFACLLAPHLAVRQKDQRAVNLTFSLLVIVAIQAMLFAPLWSLWVWAVLLGVAQGALLALALTLIVLRSRTSPIAAELSALSQFVGYLLASLAPLSVGVLRDWTGSFVACSLPFAGIGIAIAVSGWLAGRSSYVGG